MSSYGADEVSKAVWSVVVMSNGSCEVPRREDAAAGGSDGVLSGVVSTEHWRQ